MAAGAAATAVPPPRPPRLFNSLLIPLLLSLIVVASPSLVWAREHPAKYHIVDTKSLLPRSSCSIRTGRSPSGVSVVHRDGPCSPLASRDGTPSHVELLRQDQARVDSIHHRAAGNDVGSMAATLPASTGTDLGTGNYIVTIGLGTPSKDYSVVFDTGSDLTWVQCLPCQNCYSQRDPIFDPTQSPTFGNIPCGSSYCGDLAQASCSNSTCQYDVQYGDNSRTEGSFVQDTLKFSSDSIPNFRFGCGHDNSGLFGKVDGLLGLGREPVSLVSQTAQQYGKTFSYCLPSRSSNTGYLTLGNGNAGAGVQFTPMLTDPSLPSFYFLKLVGISLGGQRLPLSPTVFTAPGTLLDSGTVITRLPPSAYTSLRDGFRRLMTQYPRAPALSILDTCYDFTGYSTVKVPTIGLLLDAGLTVNLDFTGILYVSKLSQACLAFAGNDDPSDVVIVGNVQQRKFNVVYDVANLRIGFGANGCG